MASKIKLVILGNEYPEENALWIKACEKRKENVSYRIVDLTRDNWLEEIQKEEFDHLLCKPSGLTSKFKELYDERVYILERTLKYKVFPTAEEVFIYENKRFLSFWLKANKIPHPKTNVFYEKQDAMDFLKIAKYPVVGKVNIGASGSGVQILKDLRKAKEYVETTFSAKGAKHRVGPNMEKGNLIKRGLHYVFNPGDIKKKLKFYSTLKNDKQSDFVIFQEFIPHNFEWRVVRIGDSYFAHQKVVKDGKASGSLIKDYQNPPLAIFDFVKQITDKYNFHSQAIDIFESANGYLVNEMQCIFGQSDSFQMKVNGVIGRYIHMNGKWVFEPGDFNANESFDLRLDWIISKAR